MKIRLHRGALADSMDTVAEIGATRADVLQFIRNSDYPMRANPEIELRHYGIDERTGGDTYLVLVDGYPVAWTDAPLAGEP